MGCFASWRASGMRCVERRPMPAFLASKYAGCRGPIPQYRRQPVQPSVHSPSQPSDSARLHHGDTLFPRSLRKLQGNNGRQRAPQLASRPFARKGPRLSGYQSAPDRPGQPSCPRNWTGWSARRRDVQVDVNPWRHCVDRDEAAQLLAELRPSASLVVSGQLPCASIKKKCRVTLLTSSRSKQRDCSERSSTAIFASTP